MDVQSFAISSARKSSFRPSEHWKNRPSHAGTSFPEISEDRQLYTRDGTQTASHHWRRGLCHAKRNRLRCSSSRWPVRPSTTIDRRQVVQRKNVTSRPLSDRWCRSRRSVRLNQGWLELPAILSMTRCWRLPVAVARAYQWAPPPVRSNQESHDRSCEHPTNTRPRCDDAKRHCWNARMRIHALASNHRRRPCNNLPATRNLPPTLRDREWVSVGQTSIRPGETKPCLAPVWHRTVFFPSWPTTSRPCEYSSWLCRIPVPLVVLALWWVLAVATGASRTPVHCAAGTTFPGQRWHRDIRTVVSLKQCKFSSCDQANASCFPRTTSHLAKQTVPNRTAQVWDRTKQPCRFLSNAGVTNTKKDLVACTIEP